MQEQFFFILGRLIRRSRKLLDQRLKDLGVTQALWTTLAHLHSGGDGIPQRDLANRMSIASPTLVRLLDSLEKQGLLERRACNDDRRVHKLFLTPHGNEFMHLLYNRSEELQAELLDGIPEEDLEVTFKVIDQLLSNSTRLR